MDAPKCRVCGKREWNHLCGVEGLAASMPKKATLSPIATRAVGATGVLGPLALPETGSSAVLVVEGGLKLPTSPQGFDRKSYQRAYMVKWRARKKEKDNEGG